MKDKWTCAKTQGSAGRFADERGNGESGQRVFFARVAFERFGGAKSPVTARGRKLVFWNLLRHCASLKDRRHGFWTATARNVIPNDNAGNGLRGMPFPRLKSRGPIEATSVRCVCHLLCN